MPPTSVGVRVLPAGLLCSSRSDMYDRITFSVMCPAGVRSCEKNVFRAMYRGRLVRFIVVILIIGSAPESAAVHCFRASDARTTFLVSIHSEHYAESGFAVHHAIVTFVGLIQWNEFIHRTDSTESAEGKCIL
jgi:hypothetical protein